MERCLLAAITNVLFLEQSHFLESFFHMLLNRRPSADLPSLSWKRSSGTVYTGFFPQVNLAQPAEAIHNWIRGHDKVPGAWTVIDGQVCFPE